jgi:hypothetical protein
VNDPQSDMSKQETGGQKGSQHLKTGGEGPFRDRTSMRLTWVLSQLGVMVLKNECTNGLIDTQEYIGLMPCPEKSLREKKTTKSR